MGFGYWARAVVCGAAWGAVAGLVLALAGCKAVPPSTLTEVKAALQQVEPEARPIPETSPQYDEIGKGDFPLFSFPPREGSTLSVRSNKPNAVLWVSQPVTAIDVGLTLPIYALPTIELASTTSRWEITIRPEWGWAIMQALAIEDGRVLVSNAIVVRTGP